MTQPRLIPMDDNQSTRLRIVFDMDESARDLVAGIILEISKRISEQKATAWEQIRKLAQVQDDETVTIDWIQKAIIVTKAPEDEYTPPAKWTKDSK